MTFEDTLKGVIDNYNALLKKYSDRSEESQFQPEIRRLLEEKIQAREVRFGKDYQIGECCLIKLTAPGLLTHNGYKGNFLDKSAIYRSRNGEALPAEDIWMISLTFIQGHGRKNPNYIAKEIQLNFEPRLNYPSSETIDKSLSTFSSISTFGRLTVSEGGGCFIATNPEDSITVAEATSRNGLEQIDISTELLGKGILTAFFKHMGYEGLDLLVEDLL